MEQRTRHIGSMVEQVVGNTVVGHLPRIVRMTYLLPVDLI